ncbi:MAG: hypothetical protein ACPG46_01745 [Thalassotalea sp.]
MKSKTFTPLKNQTVSTCIDPGTLKRTDIDCTEEYLTEVIIAIALTPGFLNQIRLSYYSMELAGFLDGSLRINVIYSGCERKDLFTKDEHNADISESAQTNFDKFQQWAKNQKHIRLLKVPEDFIKTQYPTPFAHCNFRFHIPLSNTCKAVILCDADTVFLKKFNPVNLIAEHDGPAVAGHMVHYPPPYTQDGIVTKVTEQLWADIFDQLKLPISAIKHNCSIGGREHGLQPPNFNFGFVVVNPKMYYLLSMNFNRYRKTITETLKTPMSGQISVMAIGLENQAQFTLLPASYNAANDSLHWEKNNLNEESIFVLHYLREHEFLREEFLNDQHLEGFLAGESMVKGTQLLRNRVKVVREKFGSAIFSS